MEPNDRLLPVAESALWSQECLRRANLSKMGISPLISRFDGVGSKSATRLSAPASAALSQRSVAPTSDTPERSRDQLRALQALPSSALRGVNAPLVVALAGDVLPVSPGFRLHPLPLLTSALYGLLIAFLFTFPPLARARTQPAAALFRGAVDSRSGLDRRSLAAMGVAGALLVALALGTARDPLFAAAVLGAVGAVLLLLLGIGIAVRWGARRLPRPKRPWLRLALANLHRPGAQTAALIVALGLALTLFVTLAGIETSLDAMFGDWKTATGVDRHAARHIHIGLIDDSSSVHVAMDGEPTEIPAPFSIDLVEHAAQVWSAASK